MIDTPDALRDLIARAQQAPRVALDTEFVWERTYYPNLGLVQLGLDRDATFLIDTVALTGDALRPLGELMADAGVVKILHDAQQDLTIIRRATGTDPVNIFDTRLAGGFVGLTATTSLQALVEATVGVHLPKGESRSDWLRRPLKAAQIDYARDDVRYLPDAYVALWDRIHALGREAWVAEEMAQYDDAMLYEEDDPRSRFEKVKGRGKRGFGGRDYAVLRELAAWREAEARRGNRPRGHVVPDDALVTLAQRKPGDPQALRAARGLSDNAAKRYGDAILDAVARGLAVPRAEQPRPPRGRRADEAEQARLDLAQALIKGRGLEAQIDPGLVSNRAGVERLVAEGPAADPAAHALLQGWRGAFVGEALLDVMRGEGAVAVDPQTALPRFEERGGRR